MQTYVDLRNIFETVNNEFSKRIEETLSAKRSLEKELARVRHCPVFYSLLYPKAAQLSKRRKPAQRSRLHCDSFNQGHPTKFCTNGRMKPARMFTTDFLQIVDLTKLPITQTMCNHCFNNCLFQHANTLCMSILENCAKK